MRRTLIVVAGTAALTAGALLPNASASGADRPDKIGGARHATTAPNNKWVHESLTGSSDQDWFRFSSPRAGRALVTLGRLPADCALAVYDGSGNLIANVDHSGRRFEQIYAQVPAGDVFVEVLANAAPKVDQSYVLRFRPLASRLLVANQRDVGNPGLFDVRGELLNNTSSWVKLLQIHVTYYDKNGNKVATHDEGVIPGPIAARHRVTFDFSASRGVDVPSSARSYNIRVDYEKTTETTPGGLVINPGSHVQHDQTQQRIYHGTVTNTSSQTMSHIYPTVVEYDNRGRAIALGYGKIKVLGPGQTAKYAAAININGLPPVNGYREFVQVAAS